MSTGFTKEKKRGTFWLHLFSGFVAGAASRTVVAPLDRIKIILQTQKMLAIPEKDRYNGFFDAAKRIPQDQGYSSFWRGNGTNVFRIGPNIAIRFATYDKFKSYTMPEGENHYKGVDKFFRRIFSGFTSGLVAMMLTYPFDVVRTRLSMDMTNIDGKKSFTGIKQCMKVMINNEGIFSIYKGFTLSVLGLAPYLAIAFTSFDTIKSYTLSDENPVNLAKNIINTMGIGCIAGMTAQAITYPLDTVRYFILYDKKNRRRLMMNGGLNSYVLYKGSIDCIKMMHSNEGIRAFYAGLGVNLIKIAPAAAIQFSIYDLFKNAIFD